MENYLIELYNNLSDDEKNALLVYKSRLGLLINDTNPDYEKYYYEMSKVLNNPINILIRNTVFKNIDLTDVDSFKTSIKKTKLTIEKVLAKTVIPESLRVYRIISTDDNIDGLSKTNIISTSLSFAETIKFAVTGKNIDIYEINIGIDSHGIYIPYGMLYNSKTGALTLSKENNQDELLIDGNIYDFEIRNKMDLTDDINVIEVEAIDKIRKNQKISNY